MLIWLLFVVFFRIWGIAFVLFERDLTSPAMLLISGYTVCAGVAAVSWLSYPFAFHGQTLFVIVFRTILFLLPAYAIKILIGQTRAGIDRNIKNYNCV